MPTLSIQDRQFESIERTWLINQSGDEPRLVDTYSIRGSEQLFSSTDFRVAFPACGEIVNLSEGSDYFIITNYKTTTAWRVKSSEDRAEVKDIAKQDGYKVILSEVERIEAVIMDGDQSVRPVSVVRQDPDKNQIQVLDEKTVLLSQELCGFEIKLWQVPIIYEKVAVAAPITQIEGGVMPTCDINMLGYDLVTESWQLCEIKAARLIPKIQSGEQRFLQFTIKPDNIEFRQI